MLYYNQVLERKIPKLLHSTSTYENNHLYVLEIRKQTNLINKSAVCTNIYCKSYVRWTHAMQKFHNFAMSSNKIHFRKTYYLAFIYAEMFNKHGKSCRLV